MDDNGVRNLQALNRLVHSQELEYDFEFHQMVFPTDVPTIALSCGKSLIPSFQLQIQIQLKEGGEDGIPEISEQLLHIWRRYLLVARQFPFDVDEHLSQSATQWFVEQRQRAPQGAKPSVEALNMMLNLVR